MALLRGEVDEAIWIQWFDGLAVFVRCHRLQVGDFFSICGEKWFDIGHMVVLTFELRLGNEVWKLVDHYYGIDWPNIVFHF